MIDLGTPATRRAFRYGCIAAGIVAGMVCCSHSKAEPFATAKDATGATITLRTDPGPCVGPAKLAEHVSREGEKTFGCWVFGQVRGVPSAIINFLDGDRGDVPVAALVKLAVS